MDNLAATPETGPVDAPASMDSILAELRTDDAEPVGAVESAVQELVKEAEGKGDADAVEADAPATEDDATEPAEEADEAPEGTPETDEQLVTVKVNGEERQVPLSEAVAGYSRTEDYKAKTMAVADERRALEAERSQVEARVSAEYANQLKEATDLFARFDPVLAEAGRIDWAALKAADPAAYVQAQDAVQERLTAIQQMNATVAENRAKAEQAQNRQAEAERAQRFDAAANKIVETMPELADEAKFSAFATDAIGFLRETGFTADEIADSVDDRVLMLANDARQWRAYKAAQKSLPVKKVVPRSAVKPLTTDGSSSRASTPRLSPGASREQRVAWATRQFLSED